MTTTKMEKKPTVVMDKEELKVDPTLCQCAGVQRRWDGDGVVEKDKDGVTWYQCAACGKKYSQ